MPPRSYIYRGYGPTYRNKYTIYYGECATDEPVAYINASRNDAIFARKLYRIYATTSQYLSSYGCAIPMVCVYIYIYNLYNLYNLYVFRAYTDGECEIPDTLLCVHL